MSEKNCLNCAYCKKINQNGLGILLDQESCMRNPPIVIVHNGKLISMFPPVTNTMVCFQHLQKKDDAEKESSDLSWGG